MNYPKKPGFNLYASRHCAYITYSVKTWFLKSLSVYPVDDLLLTYSTIMLLYKRKEENSNELGNHFHIFRS